MFALLTLALVPFLTPTTSALRVTPGSPCEEKCGSDTSNTTVDDIVCRDYRFSDDPAGSTFEDCVNCELESEYFITESGQSDVKWGLYNLRYAFSVCIFGVPQEVQSLSTPCQVSCEDLHDSIVYQLEDPTGLTSYDFCGLSSFSDSVVTQCSDCYALTDDERFMGNFIEAIREGCNSEVPRGSPFILDPTRIFDEDQIPPNTASIAAEGTDDGGGGKPDNLVLIIVLPIIGFLIILACCGVGCFFLVRRRKRKAKRQSQSDHLHERWNDTSIMTPLPPGMSKAWNGDEHQLQQQQPQTPGYPLPNSPRSFSGYSQNYSQSFYQPENLQQQQQQQYLPGQFQYLQEQEQGQQQHQQASVPTQKSSSVPILSDPPPRKSLSVSKPGGEQ